jgi:DNA helicase MCM8
VDYLHLKHWIHSETDDNLYETILLYFKTKPQVTIGLLELALDESIAANEKVRLRVMNYCDNYIAMKDLRASLTNNLVCVRGNVVKVSPARPFVQQLTFSCNNCAEHTILHLIDGIYKLPAKCSSSGCRSKSFTPQLESATTIVDDFQKIRIQEVSVDGVIDCGRVPRNVECEVFGSCVDTVIPGDTIIVTGICKFSQTKGNNSMHTLYIQVNSIAKSGLLKEQSQTSKETISLTDLDIEAIDCIKNESHLFRLLVHSLAPAIFGHELVKAGLLLGLFGGRQSRALSNQASETISIRGSSHILVVGDPGMGKSQMLTFAANLAPRGVYVSSNTTTSSGLTVTLTKESGSGEFSLEAGALILGDQGCCCIDEFDKISEREALLEAMEQQCISIAKAGITCNLPARTAVLAAANPFGGHYNKAKTVASNLKMDSALLSRFDLIFILQDDPNEEMDKYLSNHVMKLHSKGSNTSTSTFGSCTSFEHEEVSQEKVSLDLYLKQARGKITDPIPFQVLRKYIAYARKNIHPIMTPEAANVLQEFYLKLRNSYRSLDTAPITTRQLESMIRLSEARARAELRDKVTVQDAKDVIDLMKQSLFETCEDDCGIIQIDRSQMGTGTGKTREIKRFIHKLTELSRQENTMLFSVQHLNQIYNQLGIQDVNFNSFIEKVNQNNYLIKKPNQMYRLSIQ